MPSQELGESIPPDTAHAVSVSLPTWRSNVGYEEGEEWVVSQMTTGYPRFFIHSSISHLSHALASAYARPDEQAMLFATPAAAQRCLEFMRATTAADDAVHFRSLAFKLRPADNNASLALLEGLSSTVCAAFFPTKTFALAKQYWQHTGDGISSRRAEFCHELWRAGMLVPVGLGQASSRGPKRYRRISSVDDTHAAAVKEPYVADNGDNDDGGDSREGSRFLEERFGRNLDLNLAKRARSAICRRIAGSLDGHVDGAAETAATESVVVAGRNLHESDVYLFPAGMNAIFNAHRALMAARGQLPSVSFGFPYVDTLKILQKFGPGCVFYGFGSAQDLDELETRLGNGEQQRFLALFCEFPGNPLLASPDLPRIRKLADKHDFAVVVDETIGTFANVNVVQYADIVVSSLTKIFSGDSNVMGGSAVLNPRGRYYALLKTAMDHVVEDNYWPEDVVFMERNSRDFSRRVQRVNANAEAICDVLHAHRLVKHVFYPKLSSSRANYEHCRLPSGGYGGLLSVVFHERAAAQTFYDAVDVAKGPSLGTNFTLCSPYALLAHYRELPWAAQFGVDPDLVRISVGLEDKEALQETFKKALDAAEAS